MMVQKRVKRLLFKFHCVFVVVLGCCRLMRFAAFLFLRCLPCNRISFHGWVNTWLGNEVRRERKQCVLVVVREIIRIFANECRKAFKSTFFWPFARDGVSGLF